MEQMQSLVVNYNYNPEYQYIYRKHSLIKYNELQTQKGDSKHQPHEWLQSWHDEVYQLD